MRDYDISKLNVLLLDDNRHFVSIMVEILRGLGIRHVMRTEGVEQALEFIAHRPVDIAFVDIKLEGMSGFEFVELVRTTPENSNRTLKIVLVSAYAERPFVQKAVRVGADGFLVKPVKPIDVYHRMINLIENPLTYIHTDDGYFGPDRRRAVDPNFAGYERRLTDTAELV